MHSLEEPTAGFYRMRFVMGGPLVGIKLWHGPPLDPTIYDPADPETHAPMDRAHRWQALANGELVDFDRAWPRCVGDEITAEEYEFLCQRTSWAKRNDAFDPLATPRRRANWDDSSVPSFGG